MQAGLNARPSGLLLLGQACRGRRGAGRRQGDQAVLRPEIMAEGVANARKITRNCFWWGPGGHFRSPMLSCWGGPARHVARRSRGRCHLKPFFSGCPILQQPWANGSLCRAKVGPESEGHAPGKEGQNGPNKNFEEESQFCAWWPNRRKPCTWAHGRTRVLSSEVASSIAWQHSPISITPLRQVRPAAPAGCHRLSPLLCSTPAARCRAARAAGPPVRAKHHCCCCSLASCLRAAVATRRRCQAAGPRAGLTIAPSGPASAPRAEAELLNSCGEGGRAGRRAGGQAFGEDRPRTVLQYHAEELVQGQRPSGTPKSEKQGQGLGRVRGTLEKGCRCGRRAPPRPTHVEHDEGQDGGEVDGAAQGRDDAAEEVEVGVDHSGQGPAPSCVGAVGWRAGPGPEPKRRARKRRTACAALVQHALQRGCRAGEGSIPPTHPPHLTTGSGAWGNQVSRMRAISATLYRPLRHRQAHRRTPAPANEPRVASE